jgi:predicted ATP-dependent endonuclease of OLD family
VIKLHVLIIEEFRGIRKLRLDFAGKNFAVYGPNGTGKSGVVDAIEFVLTGNISRLTGQGTSNISLRAHAPHGCENASTILRAEFPRLVPSSLDNKIWKYQRAREDGGPSNCRPEAKE